MLKLAFIVGPQRSGTTLLASLLDGHPSVVVWPFEWAFFPWWNKRLRNLEIAQEYAPVHRMNHLLKDYVDQKIAGGQYDTQYALLDLRTDSFSWDRFWHLMDAEPDSRLSAMDYLLRIGRSFSSAFSGDRHDEYFVIKTMMHGFDWRIPAKTTQHRFLFTKRGLTPAYQSILAKAAGKNVNYRDLYTRSVPYFMNRAKSTVDVWIRNRDNPRFLVVELDQLKREPRSVMSCLARSMGIPYSPVMLQPTFFGIPFPGHFADRQLNTGGIVDNWSSYKDVTKTERIYLDALEAGYDGTAVRIEIPGWWTRLHAIAASAFNARNLRDSGLGPLRLFALYERCDAKLFECLSSRTEHLTGDVQVPATFDGSNGLLRRLRLLLGRA